MCLSTARCQRAKMYPSSAARRTEKLDDALHARMPGLVHHRELGGDRVRHQEQGVHVFQRGAQRVRPVVVEGDRLDTLGHVLWARAIRARTRPRTAPSAFTTSLPTVPLAPVTRIMGLSSLRRRRRPHLRVLAALSVLTSADF